MKAHLTKVSLALLSMVFLLGCQEQGSDPVGPEGLGPEFVKKGEDCGMPNPHPSCKDEEPPPPEPEPTVTLTGGMLAGAFPVGTKDTRKTLGVGNHNATKPQFIQMAFVNLGACVGFKATNGGTLPTPSEVEDLTMELTGNAADAKVTMSIVKASLGGSGDHELQVEYTGNLGGTSILLGGWPGPVTVAEGPTDVFTFTGPVVVWDREGNGKDVRLIRCPGQTVTVTLNR